VTAREVFFDGERFHIGAAEKINDKSKLARLASSFVPGQQPDTVIIGVDDADRLRANVAAAWRPT
jgi:aryl-alcohol dehydrogenase-like predicted oxidoreductase